MAQTEMVDFALTGISTVYNDDFAEWDLFGNIDEEAAGQLRTTWKASNDWSKWDYRIGSYIGQISLRQKDNFNVWELRSGSKVITMKTIYPDDYNQWRLTDDNKYLTFQTTYTNIYDGWKVVQSKYGEFEVFTQWEMDPRDWVVYDRFNDDISFEFKMAMVFLAVYYSTPKY